MRCSSSSAHRGRLSSRSWPRPTRCSSGARRVGPRASAAAPRLSVVGRAGVGVDNVDVPSATARGILVINAPTANVVSAVEHTFALLFALLRRIPYAAVSMAQGQWEKSRFLGSELAGKSLGIVGLGQVGSRVAARARAFEAKLLGYDPYLPEAKGREMGVPLVSLAELLEGSDIVTLHATAGEREGPARREELRRMRKGASSSCGAGELVDSRPVTRSFNPGTPGEPPWTSSTPSPPMPTTHFAACPTSSRRRTWGPRPSRLRSASAPDRPGSPRGAPRLVLRSGRQPSLSGTRRPSGAAVWMRLAEGTARFLAVLGGEPLSWVSVETWGLPETAASDRGRGREGSALGTRAGDRQFRQRVAPGAGPGAGRLGDAP